MKPSINRFSGPDALFEYLNPRNGHFSPLVELPDSLNPYREYGIHLHAKLFSALPLANVKSIPAFNMLDKSSHTGKKKIIESSSGNTVASLGILASYFGYEETHAYVSHEVTAGKLKMLRLFNVTPLVNVEPICPSESDTTSGIHKARQKGQEAEWYNPDQYANPDNVNAHYDVTGKELWQQTQGHIDYFCAGLGTTGTFLGTARYLKECNESIRTIGIVRSPNNPIPGPRTKNLLQEIAFNWSDQCDELIEVGTIKAYNASLKMIRAGLLVGPSSGMNFAGTCAFIDKKIADGIFKKHQPSIHIVFPCCDQPFAYMDEYFEVLPDDAFPKIHNEELLNFFPKERKMVAYNIPEITCDELLSQLDEKNEKKLVVDIRNKESFEHYHIPQAINIPEDEFVLTLEKLKEIYQNHTLYIVCDFGHLSLYMCRYAADSNIEAYSLQGGMIEWSNKNFPRVKHEACIKKYAVKN